MKLIKIIAKIAILLVVVTPSINSAYIAHAQAPVLTQQQILEYQEQSDYSQKLNHWIDKLEMAESGDNPNLVYLDVNNKYSYGCIQFQGTTWAMYTKKYKISADIMDCSAQKQLAYAMISHDYDSWTNWYNSSKYKIGLPPSSNG